MSGLLLGIFRALAASGGGDDEDVSIPAGIIVMWHGLLSAIPTGWALCDGQNGTPDLREKFAKGAAADADPGDTGGAALHTPAETNTAPALTMNAYTPEGTV